jgi:hypothetical protein
MAEFLHLQAPDFLAVGSLHALVLSDLLLPVRVRNPVSGFGGALLVYGGVSRGWGRSSHRSGVLSFSFTAVSSFFRS